MSALAWAAAAAIAGFCAALVLVRRGLVPARLMRGGSGANRGGGSSFVRERSENETGALNPMRVRLDYDDLKLIREDIQGLHVIRTDLKQIGSLLERLLEEAMAFQRTRVSPSRLEPGGEAARDAVRNTSPEPSSIPGVTRRQEGRDPGYDPAYSASAVAHLKAPSADAVNVEAKDDVVARSERHPPEAWLERRGGEGEVWLNPRVALTDPALQRWSTFFDWERRAPGSPYHATRPAVVSWSGSTGTVLRKGEAKPL